MKGDQSMKKMSIIFFVIVLTAMIPSVGIGAQKKHVRQVTYRTYLTGGTEVPHIKTAARGMAVFKPEMGGKELHYAVTVKDIDNVTAAHVHFGKKGKNGPPVVGLFAGPKKEGKFSGTLAEGTITEKDLAGPLAGKTIKDFIRALHRGELYVNVHTDKYPDGELRGQLR
jgi:CHRD domain